MTFCVLKSILCPYNEVSFFCLQDFIIVIYKDLSNNSPNRRDGSYVNTYLDRLIRFQL